MKHETRHTESLCPKCQHPLNASAEFEGEAKPKEDDFSLCINCGAVLIFGKNLELRQVDPTEIKSLAQNDPKLYAQLKQGQAAIDSFNKKVTGKRTLGSSDA